MAKNICLDCGNKISPNCMRCKSCNARWLWQDADFRQKMMATRRGEANPMWGRRGENSPIYGSNHPRWKGGRRKDGQGRIRILIRGHPMAGPDGYVLEHRLVMAEALGRCLSAKEVVHHIDGNGANNDIDNLRLFSSTADHTQFHNRRGDLRYNTQKGNNA